MNGYPLTSSFNGCIGEYPISQIVNIDSNINTILNSINEIQFINSGAFLTKVDIHGILRVYYTYQPSAPTVPSQWLSVEDSLGYFYSQDANNQLQFTGINNDIAGINLTLGNTTTTANAAFSLATTANGTASTALANGITNSTQISSINSTIPTLISSNILQIQNYINSNSIQDDLSFYISSNILSKQRYINSNSIQDNLSFYISSNILNKQNYINSNSLQDDLSFYISSNVFTNVLGFYTPNTTLNSYLQKSGGTLTGNLTISASSATALQFTGTDPAINLGTGVYLGYASLSGNYSSSSSAGDFVIRGNPGNNVILQTGGGGGAIIINSANNVSITNTLNATTLQQGGIGISTLISNATANYLLLTGGTLTGTLTGTTINATANLQEAGTNLSSKYITIATSGSTYLPFTGGNITGYLGIGNSLNTTAPLWIGNPASSSIGYLVISQNSGGNRNFKIGYDSSFNFVFGDYGNVNGTNTWTEQFKINYAAPANSLNIDSLGNTNTSTLTSSGYSYLGGTTSTGLRISGADYGNTIYQQNATNMGITVSNTGQSITLNIGSGNTIQSITSTGVIINGALSTTGNFNCFGYLNTTVLSTNNNNQIATSPITISPSTTGTSGYWLIDVQSYISQYVYTNVVFSMYMLSQNWYWVGRLNFIAGSITNNCDGYSGNLSLPSTFVYIYPTNYIKITTSSGYNILSTDNLVIKIIG